MMEDIMFGVWILLFVVIYAFVFKHFFQKSFDVNL